MPTDADLMAMATAAASEAASNAEKEDDGVDGDLLGMTTWLRNKNKPAKKQESRRDPNLGEDSDGPQLTNKDIDKPINTIAEDGQSLATQTLDTQTMFRARYGAEADVRWVQEHNAEVKRNRQLYGTSNVPDWMKTKPAAATTSPTASPSPSTSKPNTTPSGQSLAFAPNAQVLNYKPPTVTGVGVTNGAPTTFAPAGTAPTPTTPVTNPSPAPTTTNPEDNVVIRNKNTGRELTVKRKNFGNTLGENGTVSYTPNGGWELVTPAGSTSMSTVGPDGVENFGARPKPERNMVRLDANGNEIPQNLEDFRNGGQAQPVSNQINVEEKPVDTLAKLSATRQGLGDPRAVEAESQRILQGIGSLIRGEKEGAWAESYLNDIARIAWARQARENGDQNVDPRQAPLAYIEKWKDAFYGSDSSVPLVKELDQQMMDQAVSRTPTGQQVFDWKKAFGENGDNGLISRQITSNDCGTNAFATFVRSRGYNIDPQQSYDYGRKYGYHDGEQFTGPQNLARMLQQEAGIKAEAKPLDWKEIDAELDAGRPVALSSSTHYWSASAYRDTDQGREYYVGATGAVVGNPVWARADQLQYGGARPNVAVIARGEVDPNSRTVTELGLRPAGQEAQGRAALTRTPATLTPAPADSLGSATLNMSNLEGSSAAPYAPIVQKASAEENVDPILVAAILEQESNGVSGAESGAGARGLMQLMPETARELGVNDITDPDQNIRGGAKYIKQMMTAFGDPDLALAAYNAGPGAVLKYDGVPPYGETRDYVRAVRERYKRLSGGIELGSVPAGQRGY